MDSEGITSQLIGQNLHLTFLLSRSTKDTLRIHPREATAIVAVLAASQRPVLAFLEKTRANSLPSPIRLASGLYRYETHVDLVELLELSRPAAYFVHASMLQYHSPVHLLQL
jgi:hypothetical protein